MMYSFCVTEQLIVFLQSIAFGMLLGFVHGVMYFFTGIFTVKLSARYIAADVIFSVFLIISSFCFVLAYNLGSVRFYIVLGIFFGVSVYFIAFGQVINFIFDRIALTVRKILRAIFLPAIKIYEKNSENLKKIIKKSRKHIAIKKQNVV